MAKIKLKQNEEQTMDNNNTNNQNMEQTMEIQKIEELRKLGVNMTYNGKKMIEDENFKDKRFVITGSFDNISRDEIKEFIEERGGLTSDSVSKKTDVVLVGEAPGSKRDKAIELNIPIWNQDKLFEIMGIVEK